MAGNGYITIIAMSTGDLNLKRRKIQSFLDKTEPTIFVANEHLQQTSDTLEIFEGYTLKAGVLSDWKGSGTAIFAKNDISDTVISDKNMEELDELSQPSKFEVASVRIPSESLIVVGHYRARVSGDIRDYNTALSNFIWSAKRRRPGEEKKKLVIAGNFNLDTAARKSPTKDVLKAKSMSFRLRAKTYDGICIDNFVTDNGKPIYGESNVMDKKWMEISGHRPICLKLPVTDNIDMLVNKINNMHIRCAIRIICLNTCGFVIKNEKIQRFVDHYQPFVFVVTEHKQENLFQLYLEGYRLAAAFPAANTSGGVAVFIINELKFTPRPNLDRHAKRGEFEVACVNIPRLSLTVVGHYRPPRTRPNANYVRRLEHFVSDASYRLGSKGLVIAGDFNLDTLRPSATTDVLEEYGMSFSNIRSATHVDGRCLDNFAMKNVDPVRSVVITSVMASDISDHWPIMLEI